MLTSGGRPVDHLPRERPEVQHALRLAGKLPGDAIDNLEKCLDDLCATLHSPKIKRAIAAVAGALLTPPHSLSGASARTIITRSIADPLDPSEVGEAYPRTMMIRSHRRSGNVNRG